MDGSTPRHWNWLRKLCWLQLTVCPLVCQADPPGKSDVTLDCKEFRINKIGHCICKIDQSQTTTAKCPFTEQPVTSVTIHWIKRGEKEKRYLCDYVNYITGSVRNGPNANCTVLSHPQGKGSVYTLDIAVSGNQSMFDKAVIVCKPECTDENDRYGLTYETHGIPIHFADLCEGKECGKGTCVHTSGKCDCTKTGGVGSRCESPTSCEYCGSAGDFGLSTYRLGCIALIGILASYFY